MNRFRLGMTALVIAMTGSPAAVWAADDAFTAQAAAVVEPGQFRWSTADAGQGPVRVVIDIPTQRLYVYRGAALIGVSTVSTGGPGHETPVGVFTILQKQVKHRSSLYDDAPMPYMQRLTWDGVALHGGHNPGYPDSHGCVRLPTAFAKKLFTMTRLGAEVVVRDEAAVPAAPVEMQPPADPEAQPQAEAQPDATPDAPASILPPAVAQAAPPVEVSSAD